MGNEPDPDLSGHPLRIAPFMRGIWPREWSIRSRWRARLERLIHELKPDFVLTQQTVIIPTVEACLKHNSRVAVILHNVDPFCLGSFWAGTPWKCQYKCFGCGDAGHRLAQYPFFLSHIKRFREILPKIDVVVSTSDFTRRTLKMIFGVDSHVIPPLTPNIGGEAKLDESGRILFFSPVDYKGVDLALEVAGKLKDERFLFVGNAKRKTINRIKRCKNVDYVPWLANPAGAYRRARLLIMPSVIPEGYGMVCLEAMSRGIPCVVSRVGALPETIGSGGDTVTPHKDAHSWIRVLQRYSDRTYYAERSRRALAESERYSLKGNLENFLSLLQEESAGPPPGTQAP
jgi:glycosyltransferase involved in cell wall biosynthesis